MRILTYNIHHWDGRDGRADIERLSAVISQSGADLVSLNEVVHPVRRRGHLEFPLAELAQAVGMHWSFGSSTRHIEGLDWRGPVGNAILSRHPIHDFNNHLLPRLPGTQQRSVLLAHIAVKNFQHAFTFGVTHLDHALEAVRLWQIRGLLREARDFRYPHLIAGDFNTHTPRRERWVPATLTHLREAGYVDVFAQVGRGAGATFPARRPIFRIDYVFVPTLWANRLVYAEVVDNYLTRMASDHLPLLLEWDLHSCYVH